MSDIKSLDPVFPGRLAGEGVAASQIELLRDYAPFSRGKGFSPYTRTFRHMASGRHFAVVTALPGCDAYGQGYELEWRDKNGVIESGNNLFHAVVNRGAFGITVLSEQPAGIKTNESMTCFTQLFVGGVEVKAKTEMPRLLETDPVNENYHNNTLEWDYGVCLRRVRLIEGRLLGSWVFQKNPGGEIRIVYNQSGNYKLKLGRYKVGHDEESIPITAFENPPFGYPVTISDTATFYPDVNPESTSVDGFVATGVNSKTWSAIGTDAGNYADDSGTIAYSAFKSHNTDSNKWEVLYRSIFLFDTSALGSNAVISSTILSLYGENKFDQFSLGNLAFNIYASNPASNTALTGTDFSTLGSNAFASDISYSSFSIAGYNDFTLNALGLAAINKSGISKFGSREVTYDAGGSDPTSSWIANKYAGNDVWTADKGTGYQPRLVVTYTTGTTKTSSETGSGADEKIGYPGTIIVLSETGTGTDTAAGPVVSLIGTEAGLSAEVISLTNPIPPYSVIMADTGRGSEAIVTSVRKSSKGTDTRVGSKKGERKIPSRQTEIKSRRTKL